MTHKHDAFSEAQMRIASLREEARARSAALIDEVKDRGGDLVKEVQGRGERALKDSKLWIIENPAEAVGIAFVAGAIASSLFRLRRED
jgi:ElaB/YqjD/DUF883 family membrane-anchored ribosome-binding protein